MTELIDNSESVLFVEKRKKGRPRKSEVLAIYRNKETMRELSDKGYFKDYYKSRSAPVVCEHCQTKTNEFCLKQHQNTKKCQKIRANKETKDIQMINKQEELIEETEVNNIGIKDDLTKDILCDEIKNHRYPPENDLTKEKSFIVYYKVINL